MTLPATASEHEAQGVKRACETQVSKETLLLGSLRVGQGVRKETPSAESAGLGDLHEFFLDFFLQELRVDLYLFWGSLQSLTMRQDEDAVYRESEPVDILGMCADEVMIP